MNCHPSASELFSKMLRLTITGPMSKEFDREAIAVSFPKGATPLWEGERAQGLYLILSGLVRGYYLDANGVELTKCFSREGEVFSSEGLRARGPSSFTVECLEDCRCLCVPYPAIDRVMKDNRSIEEQITALYLREIARLEARSRKLLQFSARERYLVFCAENPELAGRVPLKYVASYIGIRPQSLSRIRKEELMGNEQM